MDIDGLGDSFDIRDTDSEDEGIKEGRKKKRQVVTILSFVCTILLQDLFSRRRLRSEEWQYMSC